MNFPFKKIWVLVQSNFDLLATELTPANNEQLKRLSLIIQMNVVLNRTVVVDSD